MIVLLFERKKLSNPEFLADHSPVEDGSPEAASPVLQHGGGRPLVQPLERRRHVHLPWHGRLAHGEAAHVPARRLDLVGCIGALRVDAGIE